MSVPEGYKSLGKIGISYKGDYNSNTAYERLDAVFHNGSTYLAIKDAPDGAPRDDKTNWIYLAKGYDGETVDVADSEIAFTDSETRENIASGEKVSTVFGKVKKFFTDLTAPAFAQMITTKEDLLATKVTGYVPDAKAVADTYTELNSKLIKYKDFTFTNLSNDSSNSSVYYVTLSDDIQKEINDGSVIVLSAQTLYWTSIGGNVFNVSFDDKGKTLKLIFPRGSSFTQGIIIVRVSYITGFSFTI